MHRGKVDTLASYTLWRESMLLILCKGFSRHLIQKISKRLSRFRIQTSSRRAGNLKNNVTMAKFIGTIEEFTTLFGGTLLTNAVEAYTREYKKMVGTCQHKGNMGKKCSRRLEAAHNHIDHYDRIGIAVEILKGYEKDGIVEVDFNDFLRKYHDAHQPLHKTVKILCSTHHGIFDKGTRAKSESSNVLRYGMPEKQTAERGSCPLEFVPSEEGVINALKENGKCFIHYHIFGGTIVTKEWNNTKSEITGANLYNNLHSKQFVKDYRNRIEKIVVSVHENPEA